MFGFEIVSMFLFKIMQKPQTNLNNLKNGPVIKILYDNMQKLALFSTLFSNLNFQKNVVIFGCIFYLNPA